MEKVRVLVVDDSAFMRKIISDILSTDPEITVLDTARNGKDAMEKTLLLSPDVITMDVEMPIMDGVKAVEEIMQVKPTPVVMISQLTEAAADITLRALQNGAVDFVAKKTEEILFDTKGFHEEIKSKVKIAAKAKLPRVFTHSMRKGRKSGLIKSGADINPLSTENKNLQPSTKNLRQKDNLTNNLPKTEGYVRREEPNIGVAVKQMVVIGTSTGGPKALYEVIPALPGNLPAAVLIVQHMPAGFTRSLAERLDTFSHLHVKEAENGEEIRVGTVYIAPGDYHLTIAKSSSEGFSAQRYYIKLNQDPPLANHRPSVDVMFRSVAENFEGKTTGVILTGMGQDGTQGLKLLKEKNSKIIAEEATTCVVFGMPKAAIEAGVVDRIVPLPQVAVEIQNLV